MINTRLSWPEYAMELAKAAALRSEDPYRKVGACILRYDNTVASIGYNGAPPGIEINWEDRDERRRRVSHAESAALRYIKPYEGKLIAVTVLPCSECIKNIAMYGIKEVYYAETYERDTFGEQLSKEFDIKLIKI